MSSNFKLNIQYDNNIVLEIVSPNYANLIQTLTSYYMW